MNAGLEYGRVHAVAFAGQHGDGLRQVHGASRLAKGMGCKCNAEARIIGQGQAIFRGQFDGRKAVSTKGLRRRAANSIVPYFALTNQGGTHLGCQHQIARPDRAIGWNGGGKPALHHGEHEIKSGERQARGAPAGTDNTREPCGAAYPFGKIGADAGTAGQQQLRLEGGNVLCFDAVLEIAAKAGVEAIHGLVARSITGDNFPGAHELFADWRGQRNRYGAVGEFDKALE